MKTSPPGCGRSVGDFKQAVEQTDLWRVLWYDGNTRHRKELICQSIASALFRARCRVDGVDISREANIGRGPVDFKFASGWSRRGLIEVKHVESGHLYAGAERQLPQYLTSEEVTFGIYLVIAYTDDDMDERGKLKRVREMIQSFNEQREGQMELIVVDARPKSSASK